MSITLSTDIQYLKGVGAHKAAIYKKLQIETIEQLILHMPRTYIDLTGALAIEATGEACAARAQVIAKSGEQRLRSGISLYKAKVTDGENDMTVTFYNTKFLFDSLRLDTEYIFYGTITQEGTRFVMSSPMVLDITQAQSLLPVYPASKGITSRAICMDIRRALPLIETQLRELIPAHIRETNDLCTIQDAMQGIHCPKDFAQLADAKKRVVFEELFVLSCALGISRQEKLRTSVIPMQRVDMQAFWARIPFTPTDSQNSAIEDIIQDFTGEVAMNRLLQGDVGSGKTLVAAACGYFTIANGHQVALIAPTELLATQHFHNLRSIFSPLNVECILVTGSMTAKQKKLAREKIAAGEASFVIGTHALLTDTTMFADLALVVTDEQHRFGVSQRATLLKKGDAVHTLVMSATPIPRTLSLIIYGDLDISIMSQLPAGRQRIKTYRIDSGKRARAYGFIRDHLNRGLQAYIVCPLVEENEAMQALSSATKLYEELTEGEFAGFTVGLIHGKMKGKDKDKTMAQFKAGETQLLVSTTVIEVGVDVPNAVIMLIENAERFGLSQIHQLRGRVGRGNEQSYCILVSDSRGALTQERLRVICGVTDGFVIAEEDLKLRGPGDFFGNRQHGLPQLTVASLAEDMDVLQSAREVAEKLLQTDPQLAAPEFALLSEKVQQMLIRLCTTAN